MGTNRLFLGKKHIIPAVLAGIVILGIASLCFAKIYINRAEERMLKTAGYMKVQCSTYTHYNNGSETQALLRSVESSNQVRDRLQHAKKAGKTFSEELLKGYAEELWVHGIIVLNTDGVVQCSYAEDKEVEKLLLENYNPEVIISGKDYANRGYTQRIRLESGGYINMAATALEDASALIVTYYYITPECAHNYSLTLQSLLDGYQNSSDGTIMVADEGKVIACNDESMIGQETKDNIVVQALKDAGDSTHIIHISGKHCYGVMLKQRDYYIYTYTADSDVFAGLAQNLAVVFVIYMFVLVFLWVLLSSSDRKHYMQEQEQAAEYHKGLDRKSVV